MGDMQSQSNSILKQTVTDSTQSRRQHTSDIKNPAKNLNATINLEQMLNGSKSNRVLPQP